jgi:hypothetical protein
MKQESTPAPAPAPVAVIHPMPLPKLTGPQTKCLEHIDDPDGGTVDQRNRVLCRGIARGGEAAGCFVRLFALGLICARGGRIYLTDDGKRALKDRRK